MAIKTNLLDTLDLCIRFKHDTTIFSMKLKINMKPIFFQKQTEQKKHENIILDILIVTTWLWADGKDIKVLRCVRKSNKQWLP